MNLVFEIDRNRLVDAATGAQVSSLQFAYPDKYPLSISVSKGNQPFVFSGNVYVTLKPASSPLSAPLALLTVPVNSSSTVSGVLDTYIQEMDDFLPAANKRAAAFEVLVVAPSATTEVSVSVNAQISRRYNSVDQPGVTVAEKSLATQTEAEAGTNNTKWMSPLRVSQAIASLANPLDDTDDLSEGTENLYFTEARAKAAVATDISTAVSAEATARSSADSSLAGGLNDLISALSTESQTRAAGDSSLAGGLASEASTRAAADTALDQRIDFLASNLDPAALDSITEAAASINDLQTQIDGKQPEGLYVKADLLVVSPRPEINGRFVPADPTQIVGNYAFQKVGSPLTSLYYNGELQRWQLVYNDDIAYINNSPFGDPLQIVPSSWLNFNTNPQTSATVTITAAQPQHKSAHAIGGTDVLTPADIGAQPAGSYATLVGGLVLSSQLPSYVDDVLEFANLAAFPATGETGKIYVTLTTPPKAYRWSGSTYIEISPSEVTSVAGKTGAVTLTTTDISGLSSALDAKQGVRTTESFVLQEGDNYLPSSRNTLYLLSGSFTFARIYLPTYLPSGTGPWIGDRIRILWVGVKANANSRIVVNAFAGDGQYPALAHLHAQDQAAEFVLDNRPVNASGQLTWRSDVSPIRWVQPPATPTSANAPNGGIYSASDVAFDGSYFYIYGKKSDGSPVWLRSPMASTW